MHEQHDAVRQVRTAQSRGRFGAFTDINLRRLTGNRRDCGFNPDVMINAQQLLTVFGESHRRKQKSGNQQKFGFHAPHHTKPGLFTKFFAASR